jgi:dTDP-4-dehydrorhamnose reductase
MERITVPEMSGPAPMILVTGFDGQVARELVHVLPTLGEVVACTREELDITSNDAIRRVLERVRPDVVINAAAYTAVDLAESEPETAFAINAEGAGALAREAARLGARFIHYSTDYVFDGTKGTPYHEDDSTNPLNVYGASKLKGERLVLQEHADAIILRTSWVYAAHGKNFMLTMLRLAAQRDELRVINDQFGAPTSAGLIARATTDVLRALVLDGHVPRHRIYHLTASGITSWHDFARAVFEIAHRSHRNVRVNAIASSEYPTAAARPAYSVLDCARLENEFGIPLPPWRTELEHVLSTLSITHGAAA